MSETRPTEDKQEQAAASAAARPPEGGAPSPGEVAAERPEGSALAARPRVAKLFRLQWEEAQQAWVLLYPEGMVKLNASAGEIMKRCDGSRTVAEIVADLEQAFGATGLENDVLAFLDIARRQRWIET